MKIVNKLIAKIINKNMVKKESHKPVLEEKDATALNKNQYQ